MTGKAKKDLAASILARLKNKAQEQGRDFNFLLNLFCQERFLYRLSISKYRNNIILKGGLLLISKGVPLERPTRDIDVLGIKLPNDIARLTRVIKDICNLDAGDGVEFDTRRVAGDEIMKDGAYPGTRLKFSAFIGTAKVAMQVDFAFGESVVSAPVDYEYPSLLDFQAPILKAYSLESVISEKFEAMCKLGIANSRMKDFYDTLILVRNQPFDGDILREAIIQTFETRGTELKMDNPVFAGIIQADPDMHTKWGAFIKRTAVQSAPAEFAPVVNSLADFFKPVVNSIVLKRPYPFGWEPGAGIWREK